MKRLTKRNIHGVPYYPECFDKCAGKGPSIKCHCCYFEHEIIIKLAEYEDLEEQGRLIVLPCRDGDTVYKICSYYICDYDDDCPEFRKCEDEYEEPCEYQYKGYCVTETRFRKEMLAVLGKTVFLTKEEAEKALAEMRE